MCLLSVSQCRRKRMLIQRKQLIVLVYRHTVLRKQLLQSRPREHWVHPLLQSRERDHEGDYFKLMADMRALRPSHFFQTFRMPPEVFDVLLNKLGPKIVKKTTKLRKPISVGERLAVTLRFLATGDSYFTIASSFRMSKSIVAEIVPETCTALWDVLQPEVMPVPDVAGWKKIAKHFNDFWQFPLCLGSIDGKHVQMQAPANSGSLYFNYKKTHSIVLLAVVDAHYNFIMVDVGAYGRQSDGSVFTNSTFGQMLRAKQLPLPNDAPLPRTSAPCMPHVFVGDEAFPLCENLMRPYPGENLTHSKRVFNYRLSRARRIVENAFGILSLRFRIYRRPLTVSPENADKIIKGTVVLHNFLRLHVGVQFVGPTTVDVEDGSGVLHPGDWRNDISNQQLLPLRSVGRRYRKRAMEVRETFTEYFNSAVGKLSWQDDIVQRTT